MLHHRKCHKSGALCLQNERITHYEIESRLLLVDNMLTIQIRMQTCRLMSQPANAALECGPITTEHRT